MTMRERWEDQAGQWLAWARAPGHDSFWRHHGEQFSRLLPPPGELTLDIGCGEGRLSRQLKSGGHRVIGLDASPSLIAAARQSDPTIAVIRADAASLPLADACADLAIAFMSLQDVDAMPAAVHEAARVLQPGGRLCMAIVHPLNSAGRFAGLAADAPFVIQGSYLDSFTYSDPVERDGLSMTFHSAHRPLQSYFAALEQAGFLIEALREPSTPEAIITRDSSRRWLRVPLFLHLRCLRP
ncbi:class I SAM-dependent methyltransferase [Bradyrhizobium sp. 83012]|uniref:Class I SAM-dependent methyltransferase n=1 Tax=Bradyrhizobium aeschynomenes TaxID=2734909 RepID=A0ABX2CLD2_9BRAD|nr:class I SAM-dependent methyltransferase [Bradyrhizobium aeschynomenes]NPU11555.1 class I SAM-dependent methyltransferase [Bradyrhizobium aeschynomenes]NPU69018.1 class I SAM-dependent methyltransferase [Bradyrhizobium aeschynomenes]